jgi:transcriptional regulator with XRE-family HTH domain
MIMQQNTPTLHTKLGALVRAAREKRNMTQLELSQRLGYGSMQFVSLFERGLSKIPPATLGKLIVLLQLNEKQIVSMLLEEHEAQLMAEIKAGKKAV